MVVENHMLVVQPKAPVSYCATCCNTGRVYMPREKMLDWFDVQIMRAEAGELTLEQLIQVCQTRSEWDVDRCKPCPECIHE